MAFQISENQLERREGLWKISAILEQDGNSNSVSQLFMWLNYKLLIDDESGRSLCGQWMINKGVK